MSDGCKHIPPAGLSGYDVESFTEGPQSTTTSCAVSSNCDHSHIFEIRNFHLYEVRLTVDATSMAGGVESCYTHEDVTKRTQWTMNGRVPAAPYRPSRRVPPYGLRRFREAVRTTISNMEIQDVISMEYTVDSPVNNIMTGSSFNVPVNFV
jgi:hypothetical protein